MSFTIGDYLITRLAEAGVRHMFGVPGDFNLWFLDQIIADGRISWVGCCNELNAAYAADGYSRLAGMSALAVTYGVGELAALSGVAGAYAERVPLVCIGGAPPLHAIREGALLHHTMADGNFDNTLSCYREFTAAQARIEPASARDEIDRVLRTCWLEKRPVYLQFPSDAVAINTAPIAKPLDQTPPASDSEQLARAVSRISGRLLQSSSPAILLDADAVRFGLMEKIIRFAEANALPIAHLIPAKGALSDFHPLYAGMYSGAGSPPRVRETVEKSDCLICVGTRFTDVASGFFSHSLRPGSVIELLPFGVKIAGEFMNAVSAGDLLSGLLAEGNRTASARARSPHSRANGAEHSEDQTLTQAVFWRHIQGFLRPGDVVVSDTGTCLFGAAGLAVPEGVSFVAQPIWGSIGYALPAILGTCLAAPNRRQLLFIGDGAFQMTAQELSTILRLDLKPVIFLINNDGYTIERLILGAGSPYNDIQPWRYGQVLTAFGAADPAPVPVVRNVRELEIALGAAGDASRLHFIELILPRMDAPEPLVRMARRAAEFAFPQVREHVDQ
jgi:indolepyruvate decarboxylase